MRPSSPDIRIDRRVSRSTWRVACGSILKVMVNAFRSRLSVKRTCPPGSSPVVSARRYSGRGRLSRNASSPYRSRMIR
nr:hypothetical protein GCM10020092_057770 [Actinoplanes digitatis]